MANQRRISYTIASPSDLSRLPTLRFPPINSLRGSGPSYQSIEPPISISSQQEQSPRNHSHRLPVRALALDLTTVLPTQESNQPAGILFSGGKDGLLVGWELGLPVRPRRFRYGEYNDREEEERRRLEEDLEVPESQNSSSINSTVLPPPRTTSNGYKSTPLLNPTISMEEQWEIDSERLKISRPPPTAFRQCIQPHTAAINSLSLVDGGRAVVSGSDDGLVNCWTPHSEIMSQQLAPSIIGRHGDYIRALSNSREGGYVASGGFDRSIKLWDVQEGRSSAITQIDSLPESIYSLSSTLNGNLIAAGSPDKIIRLYDPRTFQREVSTLAGHSDIVRSVLLSEDGNFLLSASSDTTVKLFSVKAQQCLYSFEMHNSSVWSLFSQHPTLERFVSGDRDGNICKVDFEGYGDPGDGECILLGTESEGINSIVGKDDSFIWTAAGTNEIKRWKDVKPRYQRQTRTFTASPIPIDPPSPPLENTIGRERSPSHTVSFREDLTPLSRTISTPTSSFQASQLIADRRPSSLRATSNNVTTIQTETIIPSTAIATLDEIPYDSLIPLGSSVDSYFSPTIIHRNRDPETATMYSTEASIRPTSLYSSHRPRTTSMAEPNDSISQAIGVARREYLDRLGANEATPLRENSDAIIEGSSGGIRRVQVLNDRRHALTSDTDQRICLWDLAEARCIGVFSPEEYNSVSRRGSNDAQMDIPDMSRDELEYVKERIEGEGSLQSWFTSSIRSGSLTIHLDESHLFDGEAYADESFFEDSGILFPRDHRINFGKIVLKSLFDEFITAQVKRRNQIVVEKGGETRRSTEAPRFISLPTLDTSLPPNRRTPGMTIALATGAKDQALPTPRSRPRTPMIPTPTSPARTPRSSLITDSSFLPILSQNTTPSTRTPVSDDYFSLPPSQSGAIPVTPKESDNTRPSTPGATPTSGGLMGRFGFGKSAKKNAKLEGENLDTVSLPITTGVDTMTPEEAHRKERLSILSQPLSLCPLIDAPPLNYNSATSIMISEQTDRTQAAGFTVIFRGLVGTTGIDSHILEQELPLFALDFLLGNKTILKEPVKISFILFPWGGPGQGFPELPNANARLTANRSLRVRKVCSYVADKLNLRISRSRAPSISSVCLKDKTLLPSTPINSTPIQSISTAAEGGGGNLEDFDAESEIEILCGDVILPVHITLATIKAFYWRKSGMDILLHYRPKRFD